MSRLFNRLIISLLLIGLFGCDGSDGGSDESNPSEKISISAQDTLKLSQFNIQTTIDLRSRVQAENNESLLISDVKSINGDCDILSVDGLSFNVYSRHPDVCRFEYTVTPASDNYTGSAKALSQVVLNEEPQKGEYLPPISRTMLKNENIRFNSSDLVEPGYVLDPSSVFALSGTGASEIGELSDISESGFTYQAPNTETVVRIFYSVINKTDNIVRPGIIYIAIGQNANISPNAQDSTLEAGTLLEKKSINIEDLVSDVDSDELQLVYARGVIGDIDISGRLEFQYKPSSTGHEYITYIVSDHNGGYGIGLLDFNISTYPVILDTDQQLLFLPPMTMASPELAMSTGSHYEAGTDGFQGFYPIFTQALASSYCITQGGRLPTVAELTAMWKNVINGPVFQSNFKWHSSLPYLTSTDWKQVSLIDGHEISSEASESAYFSCVVSTKEPTWEFSQPFASAKLNEVFKITEIVHLVDERIQYRSIEDYKLQTKILAYYKNGIKADPDEVEIDIYKDTIKISLKEASLDTIFIKVIVTDDDIKPNPDIHSSMIVNVGFTQCEKGITPEASLSAGCVYTVGFENEDTTYTKNTRFTLAIPTNIIGTPPPQDEQPSKIFGRDGVSFIGVNDPNTHVWQDYVQQICDIMNSQKVDGRTNWTPGVKLTPESMYLRYATIKSEDYEATKKWVKFLLDVDGLGLEEKFYGQGFAGLPGNDYVVNQEGDLDTYHIQVSNYDGTYTFASCVSTRP